MSEEPTEAPILDKALTSIAESIHQLADAAAPSSHAPSDVPIPANPPLNEAPKEIHSILKTEVARYCTAYAIDSCHRLYPPPFFPFHENG